MVPKELNIGSTPNIITVFRAIGALGLLFFSVESPVFWVIYFACGISDMLDGYLARKMNATSEFGAKLDTIADIIFVVVCIIKLLPILEIPNWLLIWVGVIAIIKIINIVSGFVVQKKFVTVHSIMNKITGFLLFAFPLTLSLIDLKYSAAVVCIFATFAAIQEGHFIRSLKSGI